MSLTIAISGMPGAGSSSVGKSLAKELNLQFFSIGRLFKDIGLGIVKTKSYYPLFKKLCDSANLEIPSFSSGNDSEAVKDLWASDFGKSERLHKIIDRLQQELANRGNIVIDGKLALRMIPKADVKIWIKAGIEERAERAAKRDGITKEEAKEIIIGREKKERAEWKKIYGVDYFEQESDADFVIDSSNASVEDIKDEIIEHLEEKGLK